MKILTQHYKKMIIAGALACLVTVPALTEPPRPRTNVKIAIVNFKDVVEGSKIGKQEQEKFGNMKKQMETILEEKEKEFRDISSKLNDIDYLDSISAEAETELKRKMRSLSQELQQFQSQYLQALQQANYKIVQEISEEVTKASETIARNQNFDLVFNSETLFYVNPTYNISAQVIKEMDANFKPDQSETKTQ